MEEKIIYVAGNPNLYPVEYYDIETKEFQGLIPELLQRFSKETGYDVRYYQAGEDDIREQLANNRQVDIISGCTGTEDFIHESGEEFLVLETAADGEEAAYWILLSDAAPESLGEDLRSYLSEVTWQDKTSILLQNETARAAVPVVKMQAAIVCLLAVILALAGSMTAIIVKNRRWRKRWEQNKDTDSLTGIGNMEYISRTYKNFVNDGNRILYGMFYLHIDTEVMDRMEGRAKTNEFLRHTAAVLVNYTSDTDILARVSDGGFILLRLSPNEQEAGEWAAAVLERIKDFPADRTDVQTVRMAVGIYWLKADDYDLDEVIFYAEQSALAACREEMPYKFCTEEVIQTIAEERKLRKDIAQGLQDGEFRLYVQFNKDGKDGSIVGGEALSRWEHPEKGFLHPAQFIPLLEKEGMISELDYYLLDKACAFLEEIHGLGMERFFLSCNFSEETFSAADFIDRCREITEKYQFERKNLVFEITGSAGHPYSALMKDNAAMAKKMGVWLAVDGFGGRFATFSDIWEFEPDILKLDKSLTDQAGTETGNALLKAIIRAGHELKKAVTAEGIEEESQAEILRDMQCDMLQGYYFYHPIPEWDAKKELRKQCLDMAKADV